MLLAVRFLASIKKVNRGGLTCWLSNNRTAGKPEQPRLMTGVHTTTTENRVACAMFAHKNKLTQPASQCKPARQVYWISYTSGGLSKGIRRKIKGGIQAVQAQLALFQLERDMNAVGQGNIKFTASDAADEGFAFGD